MEVELGPLPRGETAEIGWDAEMCPPASSFEVKSDRRGVPPLPRTLMRVTE